MLGPIKHAIQGKTTRSKPDVFDVNLQKMDVPNSIMKFYKDEKLAMDAMHVNYVPFLTKMSESIHYGTIAALNNLKCQ